MRTRGFHAAWIGIVLAGLIIVFDGVAVWALAMLAIAGLFLLGEWLFSLPRRDSYFGDRRDPD